MNNELRRLVRAAPGVIAAAALALSVSLGQAWAQAAWSPSAACPQVPGSVRAAAISTAASPELALFAREASREGVTYADLELVRNACRNANPALTGRIDRRARFNAPAFLCVGDAQARMATLGNAEQNYQDAFCAYGAAADLAGRAGAQGARIRAEAEEKRAAAALAWRDLATAQSARGAQLLSLAIAALEAAIAAEPSSERNFALALAYMQAGRDADAERAIAAGAQGAPPERVATAFVELAEQRIAKGAAREQVLPLLERARAASPRLVAAHTLIGDMHLKAGDIAAARAAYLAANAPGGLISPDSMAYLAGARYRLADLAADTASTPSDWEAVRTYALSAVQAGGAGLGTATPLCLSHIALGGPGVKNGENASWCDNVPGAEGQLLRGLFLLRRAQYHTDFRLGGGRISDTEASWRGYVTQAQAAFATGQALLTATPAPVADPGRVALQRQLADGAALTQWVVGFCRGSTPGLSEPGFFGRLQVNKCRP